MQKPFSFIKGRSDNSESSVVGYSRSNVIYITLHDDVNTTVPPFDPTYTMTDASSIRPPALVCVTGATGYIASFIVRDLLARGYNVRATVRSVSNRPKLAPLLALPHAATRLQLVEADLLRPETLRAALAGCCALIHPALPVHIRADGTCPFATMAEAEYAQIRPAVAGTRALLQAAIAVGLYKVVLTSSAAAMNRVPTPHRVLDESCWSDDAFLRTKALIHGTGAYALAKTLQERLSWEFAAEHGLHLVTINPVVVIGPSFTTHLNISLEFLHVLVNGKGWPYANNSKGTVPDAFLRLIDVRDVSLAHVLALERADANGRYLLMSHNVHFEDVVTVMRQTVPAFASLPATPVDSVDGRRHVAQGIQFDNSKAVALGVKGIPWETTVADSAKALAAYYGYT